MSDPLLHFAGESMEDLQQFLLHARPGTPVSISLKGDAWGPSVGTLLGVASGALDVRTLSLRGTRIGDYGIGMLTGVGALATVRSLSLERSGLTDRSLELLGACPDLGALRELYLCNRVGVETGIPNAFTDVGGVTLAASPHLGELATLDLWETGIGDATLATLLVSPGLPRLSSLTLWGTRVTREGVIRARTVNRERWLRTRNDPEPATSCNILSDHDDRVIDYSLDPTS